MKPPVNWHLLYPLLRYTTYQRSACIVHRWISCLRLIRLFLASAAGVWSASTCFYALRGENKELQQIWYQGKAVAERLPEIGTRSLVNILEYIQQVEGRFQASLRSSYISVCLPFVPHALDESVLVLVRLSSRLSGGKTSEKVGAIFYNTLVVFLSPNVTLDSFS